MTKRPPQGRGSGGRVTPSPKDAEPQADEDATPRRRARVPTSSKPATSKRSSRSTASGATSTPAKGDTGSKSENATSGNAAKAATRSKASSKSVSKADRSAPLEVDEKPIWGMGEMSLWWMLSLIIPAIVYVIVAGFLVSSGAFAAYWPNEEGWAIGQVAGQIGTGQVPDVTVGVNGAPLAIQVLLQVPLWLVLIAGPLVVARTKKLSLRDDFGLSFKAIDAPIGLVLGVASQLVLIPAIYWVIFQVLGDQDVSASARALTNRADDVFGVLALVLIVGIGAPIAEEIFYRGLSQHAIAKRFGPRLAILLGAAFFGASHLQPLQFAGLFAFGLVVGTLAERFRRIGPAIWAHVGFNLTAAAVLLWDLPFA